MSHVRSRWWCAAATFACALCLATPTTADQVDDIVGQASIGEFQSYLRVLTGVDPVPVNPPVYLTNRYAPGPQARAAATWIQARFAAFGLDAALQSFPMSGGRYGQNVIGELRGTSRPDDVYVICAHYDTAWTDADWIQPGCDDNGSGTGAVMMAARILSQYQFDGTLRFVAFSGEEQGLVGSAAYVAQAHAAGENIVAAINCDMILHPGWDRMPANPDYDLDICENSSSDWLAQYVGSQVAAHTSLGTRISTDSAGRSDHASFWDYGYSAVGLSEHTSDEIHFGANEEYHTRWDTFDNPHLDWEFGLQTVRGGMAGLIGLAGLVPEPGSAAAVAVLVLLVRRQARPLWKPKEGNWADTKGS